MLHIRPICEEQANPQVAQIYHEIKDTLQVAIVPLLFQYVANFEEYFIYVWDKIKANLQSDYFRDATRETIQFTQRELDEIFTPSSSMMLFVIKLSDVDKEDLLQTVRKLYELNAKLLLLTVGMREGLKGVHVKEELLLKEETGISKEFFETFSNVVVDSMKKEAAVSSKMLAPLFGSQALAFSNYADFFSKVSGDMDHLIATEDYLHKRVLLEHHVLQKTEGFLPLGCSYAEVAKYAMGKPHFGELLYILTETFPSQFPRMLFASLVMQKSLTYNPSSISTRP